ncbi:hypothetical protein, partial [Falsiroseomonas oryziterrae]|uniref:hypothetical protein n=1 Tax=Falsiroseomonas oryziterrae TaxID=2911368 RepID=UPI0035592522
MTWPRQIQLVAGVLVLLVVLGWGLAFNRGGTLSEMRLQLRAAETRVAELQRSLAEQQRAVGELNVVTGRRDAAQQALAQAEARARDVAGQATQAQQALEALQPQIAAARQALEQA